MKTNYNDFMNDWEELKIKAIGMSHQLSKFKRTVTDFSKFNINDIGHEIDEDYKTKLPIITISTSQNESCGCCYSDLNFSVPINVLFTEKDFNEYIENEKYKIEQENIELQKQKEKEIKKEKEQKIENELKKIESEKKLLLELIQKYPGISNEDKK